MGTLASRLIGAEDGAYAPGKTHKRVFHFRNDRRLDVRMEESWSRFSSLYPGKRRFCPRCVGSCGGFEADGLEELIERSGDFLV